MYVWSKYRLALLLFGFFFLFSISFLQADPRNPLPETPSQVWQNDLDLRDMIDTRISKDGSSLCIDNPTFCADQDTGIVTQATQPSFLVHVVSDVTNQTGDSTVVTVTYGTEVYDQNNDIENSTFTAPVTGKYLFTIHQVVSTIAAAHTFKFLSLVTSNRTYSMRQNQSLAQAEMIVSFSVIADMDANDTAYVQLDVRGSTKTVGYYGGIDNSSFSGSLIN